jgi:hypothetical protein
MKIVSDASELPNYFTEDGYLDTIAQSAIENIFCIYAQIQRYNPESNVELKFNKNSSGAGAISIDGNEIVTWEHFLEGHETLTNRYSR